MKKYGFSAPHFLARETGNDILAKGGSAIDAMVAAAATITVVYPHMNSMGGDGFWLIQRKGEAPIAIDACGRSAKNTNVSDYDGEIPTRGLAACITQAGTVSGWQMARDYLTQWRSPMQLRELFSDAIRHANHGIEVTQSFVNASDKMLAKDGGSDAFKQIFTNKGNSLKVGDIVNNPKLSILFCHLIENGLNDFYQGEVAKTIASFFEQSASPLSLADFNAHTASFVTPLSFSTRDATLYNLPAPTQGIASLIILAIYDQLYQDNWDEAEQIHHLVEATKQAFQIRDQYISDPAFIPSLSSQFLSDDYIATLSGDISSKLAMAWPKIALPGDTVWMGAVDDEGTVVSFIQSVYWEFGSGEVIPEYGLVWNNRGVSFSMDDRHINYLQPNKKPMHTLNPAFAVFNDGRRMAYGTMGGEGQPQTQAAIFNYFHYQNQPLSDSIANPRWLLGRTWGDASQNLKIESALMQRVGEKMQALGHDVETVADCNEMMGHAGAVLIDANDRVIAAVDPRGDGDRKTE
jgi:gamma-glutamyltranspeptidase